MELSAGACALPPESRGGKGVRDLVSTTPCCVGGVCLCFQQHHRPGAVCSLLPAPKRLDFWGDGGGGHFLPSAESWEHTGILGTRALLRLPPRPPSLLLRIQLNALGNYWPQAQNSQVPVFSCQNQEVSPFTCSLLNPTSRLPLGLPQLMTQAGKSTTRC